MNLKDPKNFDKRILTGAGADHQAARKFQQEQQNPMLPEFKRLEGEIQRMMMQSKATAIRLNAVMDYMGHIGWFLTQELDEQGFPVGLPSTPLDCPNKIFEGLIDAGIISDMPAYGFDAFFVEHNKLSDILIMLNSARMRKQATMTEVIEAARAFNEEPKRITKILGTQIGLVEYINENPDNLSKEEIVALGNDFQLEFALEEEPKDEDAEADQEVPQGEDGGVPPGANDEPQGDDIPEPS